MCGACAEFPSLFEAIFPAIKETNAMSDYTVIRAVSETLRELLRLHITNDTEPQLNGVKIDLRSPREMREDNEARGVSLWLYRIVRNPDLLNSPPARPAPDQIARHSLPIDLYYLVTPIAAQAADEQVLMGRALQTFNDHPILRGGDLEDPLKDPDELRLALETPSVEEQTRIWHSLQESYQLSVTYRVQLVTIDAAHEPIRSKPVLVRQTNYRQAIGVEKVVE